MLHQVLAVLFRWGFSERTLTLMLSGLAGMLSLQALALIILTRSGRVGEVHGEPPDDGERDIVTDGDDAINFVRSVSRYG